MVASTSASIAWVILLASLAGWILYAIFNVRAGRAEVGSEQSLAANRKPYYDDEVLEGRRLERVQLLGLVFLAILTVALPLYWVLEPNRQEEAQFGFEKRFAEWGGKLFAPTAEGGYNCAGCHGGMKANDAKRLKELEQENGRLKKLLAEAELDKLMADQVCLGDPAFRLLFLVSVLLIHPELLALLLASC